MDAPAVGPEPERAEPEPEPETEAPVGEWQVLMCGDLALTASKAGQGATLHVRSSAISRSDPQL